MSDKLARQSFQCISRRHLPEIAAGLPDHGWNRQVVTPLAASLPSIFNASAGHTSETGAAQYGRLADGQPHTSQTLSTEQIIQFIDISEAWQYWLGIGTLSDDFICRYHMELPVKSEEWCWQVAINHARNIAHVIMGDLDSEGKRERVNDLLSVRAFTMLHRLLHGLIHIVLTWCTCSASRTVCKTKIRVVSL